LRYISRSTLWLLLVDDLLPDDVERVLAVDGDILVREDPSPLLALDLGGNPIAAVRDAEMTQVGRAVAIWRPLGVAPDSPYFNAGVILIDRAAWREEQVGRRALAILRDHPGELLYNEQDALNVAVAGRWTELPWRWNVQAPAVWGFPPDAAPVYSVLPSGEVDEALASPALLHYSGGRKPWHQGASALPFWDEWAAMRARTSWALEPPHRGRSGSVLRAALGRLRRAAGALVGAG
jgi:lipopolysaccharide biosynthesis glycosyltransferase